MSTMLNIDKVDPGRVPGYPTNFLAAGWLERVSGSLLQGKGMRATIPLNDDDARKVLDWLLANPCHAYPYTINSTNQIVGVELVSEAVRV